MIYEAHVDVNEDESYYFIRGKDEDGKDVYWSYHNLPSFSYGCALRLGGCGALELISCLISHGLATREAYDPRTTDYGHGVVVERKYKYACFHGVKLSPESTSVTEITSRDDTEYGFHANNHCEIIDKEQYVALKAFIKGEAAIACEGLTFHDAVKMVSFDSSNERRYVRVSGLQLRRREGHYFAGGFSHNEIDALTYELLNRVLDDEGE